jgi:hypothetical protein
MNRPRMRSVVAVLLGAICGYVSWQATRIPVFLGQDFQVWWYGGEMLLDGRNPYTSIVFEGRPGFLYPLTAAVVGAPFTILSIRQAGPLFIGLSCGCLAYLLTKDSWWPLLMFASGAMYDTVIHSQFSALLMMGFVAAGAMWAGSLKPNIGLAMLAYRPSWKALGTMAAFGASTLILQPTWPLDWLRVLRAGGGQYHFSPILAPGGFLLALAAFRWRTPEGRLLLAMAVLPSSPIAYETLPLFVIPRSWQSMSVLAVATTFEYWLMVKHFSFPTLDAFMQRGRTVVVLCCYLPALVIVLRRRSAANA